MFLESDILKLTSLFNKGPNSTDPHFVFYLLKKHEICKGYEDFSC